MKKLILLLIFCLAFFLRVYDLGNIPPSLYWDEASLGYNAYTISQTLRDEHGEFLPLTRFIAFGDYKPPGYIYVAALSVKLLGLNEFTVRFPSALAGSLLVLLTVFLTYELLKNNAISYLTGLFMAISPWALQMSRGAFEANLATLFSGLGIYLFLRAVSSKSVVLYPLSSIFFTLSMYTFNSHRLFVPLILLSLAIVFRREMFSQWKKTLLFGAVLVILLVPLGVYSTTREAKLRFDEVAWVKDVAPIELANNRSALDGNAWWSKIIHNRRVVYAYEFLQHYTDNFKVNFLFYSGDENKRLSIQSFGEMYWIDLPFLIVGLYFLLISWRQRSSQVILSWLLLALVPAALARETPHALRNLNILPIPQLIVALGVIFTLRFLKTLKFYKTIIMCLYLVFLVLYLHNYYLSYPQKYSASWQYGYKQVVEYVSANQSSYDHVSVTNFYGRPYIYFLFYQKYSPQKYWQTRNVDRDWFGFWYVHGFDKYIFNDDEANFGRWLYVRPPGGSPKGARILVTINDLSGRPTFEISQKTY